MSFNASWYFAGSSQAGLLGPTIHSTPGYSDAKHDIILALMNWVENGTAPDSIIATKYANDTEHTAVMRQRPICPHPKQAQYKGTGDPNAPDSWECRLPYDSPSNKPASTPAPTPAQVSAGVLCFSISDLTIIVAVLVVSSWMVVTSR